MDAHEMMSAALSRHDIAVDDLPQTLRSAIAQHLENLVALVGSMQAAGRPQLMITTMIAQLLDSYTTDVKSALEKPRE